MLVRLYSAALQGVEATEVEVEVNHVKRDLFKMSIVGLPDVAVRESTDRVLSAISNSAMGFGGGMNTINLAPADIKKEGKGAFVFINQESQSLNLLGRLAALKKLQGDGIARAPKIDMDARDFGVGAQILHDLNISKIKLMTNTTQTKRVGMVGYGLEIVDYMEY